VLSSLARHLQQRNNRRQGSEVTSPFRFMAQLLKETFHDFYCISGMQCYQAFRGPLRLVLVWLIFPSKFNKVLLKGFLLSRYMCRRSKLEITPRGSFSIRASPNGEYLPLIWYAWLLWNTPFAFTRAMLLLSHADWNESGEQYTVARG
jgi:hypothetical protein